MRYNSGYEDPFRFPGLCFSTAIPFWLSVYSGAPTPSSSRGWVRLTLSRRRHFQRALISTVASLSIISRLTKKSCVVCFTVFTTQSQPTKFLLSLFRLRLASLCFFMLCWIMLQALLRLEPLLRECWSRRRN